MKAVDWAEITGRGDENRCKNVPAEPSDHHFCAADVSAPIFPCNVLCPLELNLSWDFFSFTDSHPSILMAKKYNKEQLHFSHVITC